MAPDTLLGKSFLDAVLRPGLAAVLAVTLVVLAAYGGMLSHDFIKYDDGRMIVDRIGSYDGLSLENIRGIFLTDYPREEPLVVRDLSYLVNAALFGPLNAFGYLFGNLILHIGVSLLVYLLALRLFGGAKHGLALCAALLFAVHPVHVESVAWISSRKDPLYAFFFLWAFLSYVDFLDSGRKKLLALVFALFVLSLFSKAAAVFFVPATLAWRFAVAKRQEFSKTEAFFYATAALATVFFVFWYTGVLKDYGLLTARSFARSDWGLWLLIVCEYIGFYLGKLVFPLSLATFYDFPAPALVFASPSFFVISLVVVAALSFGILYAGMKKDRRLLFLGAFFFLALFPYLDIAQVSIFVADRYLYLASVSFCLAAAWGMDRLWAAADGRSRQVLLAAAVVVLLLFGARTRTAVATWENTATFWKNAYAVAPGRPDTHSGLMSQYLGFYEAYPKDPQAPAALEETGELGRRALARFCKEDGRCHAQTFYVTTLMGKYYWYRGDARRAEEFFRKTLALNNKYHTGRYIYASFLARQKRFAEARQHFDVILQTAHPVLYRKVREHILRDVTPFLTRQLPPPVSGASYGD